MTGGCDRKNQQLKLSTGVYGIRAMRVEDAELECERRLEAFGLFERVIDKDCEAGFALRIARALRAERRAARAGGSGYDPVRHLVLVRLNRRLQRRKRNPGQPSAL
jgi:hypothetical protein